MTVSGAEAHLYLPQTQIQFGEPRRRILLSVWFGMNMSTVNRVSVTPWVMCQE
jgi:hypothetical protein